MKLLKPQSGLIIIAKQIQKIQEGFKLSSKIAKNKAKMAPKITLNHFGSRGYLTRNKCNRKPQQSSKIYQIRAKRAQRRLTKP